MSCDSPIDSIDETGTCPDKEPQGQGPDIMREISSFLKDYDSCLQSHYLSSLKQDEYLSEELPRAIVMSAVDGYPTVPPPPHPTPENDVPLDDPGDCEPVVEWKQYSIDQYLKDFDSIIETSREAQKNALGLANSLQGVFQSVMKERNQAIDDLKRSVGLLKYSVGKLHDMNQRVQQMIQREAMQQARFQEAEETMRAAEDLKSSLIQQKQALDKREDSMKDLAEKLENQRVELEKMWQGVSQKEKSFVSRENELEQAKRDLDARSAIIASRDKETQEEKDSITAQRLLVDRRAKELADEEKKLQDNWHAWELEKQQHDEILGGINDQIATKQSEIDVLHVKERDLKETLEKLKGDIESSRQSQSDLQQETQQAKADLEAVKSQLAARASDLKNLTQELEKKQQHLNLTVESSRAEIDKIHKEKAEFENLKRYVFAMLHMNAHGTAKVIALIHFILQRDCCSRP
jgi:chromosome segregation ATPase